MEKQIYNTKTVNKILHLLSILVIVILSSCNTHSMGNKNFESPEIRHPFKKGYRNEIANHTVENENFRKVLYTGMYLQLVLMNLKPGEEIGMETHTDSDQFFRFESGKGKSIINGNEYNVTDGDVIVVPAGAKHNIVNTEAKRELKMYVIYAIPQHKDALVNKTKKDAENNNIAFDGKTTE